MTLEQKVTSLALSERLRKLGVEQMNVCFFWNIHDSEDGGEKSDLEAAPLVQGQEGYPAFTLPELLDLLPEGVKLIKGADMYRVYNPILSPGVDGIGAIENRSPVEACGEMLAYLLESGLMKLPL